MKLRIIFATGNKNKVRELKEILDEAHLSDKMAASSMKEVGLFSDPEENGTTFEENAQIKARALAELVYGAFPEHRFPAAGSPEAASWMRAHGLPADEVPVIAADDSGLCIDALGGEPGIHSARFMGHDTSYDVKTAAILEKLKGVPEEQRGAQFVCAIAMVFPDGTETTVRGVMEGRIAHENAGSNGFGYDPIFYLPELGKTSAEISEEEKNALSHRGKAMRAAARILEQWEAEKCAF